VKIKPYSAFCCRLFLRRARAVSKAGRRSLNMKYVTYGHGGGATDDVSAGGEGG